ncbi:MAG: alkaline phosphatase family protein [Phycisphaerales bacterium]|nr:alkaline phosphatase family protein [Phycisphaerales bacterium]
MPTALRTAARALAFVLAVAVGVRAAAARDDVRAFDHVIIISVDGLRSDALLALTPRQAPALHRLMAGSSTLNARTDPDYTITLPNHTAMLTGRPTSGERGHGWTDNDDPPPGENLHTRRGQYVAGVFDVAAQHGVRTALVANKSKFILYARSWGAGDARDATPGADHTRARATLEHYSRSKTIDAVCDDALDFLARHADERSLLVVHFSLPDAVGHDHGWDMTEGSPYLTSVRETDAQIARLLDAARTIDALAARTAIILTADHGGGAPFKSHLRAHMWINYVIPFFVWTGDDAPRADLYELNADARRDPGLSRPDADADPPPIRNGDAANLALRLLALPPVPGSVFGADRPLRVAVPADRP